MNSGKRTFPLLILIIVIGWTVACSTAWFVATRGDYANLAVARACYGTNSGLRSDAPECVNVKPRDAEIYMAEIDRKARISRLAGAFGAVIVLGIFIVRRR